MNGRRALVLLCVVLLLSAAARGFSLSFADIAEIDANASLVFIGSNPNPQPPGTSDPSLGVAPLIGVSVPFQLARPFFLEPGVELLGWYYQWNTNSSAAEITQAENGSGFFTIGALISFQAGLSYPVASGLTLGGAVGLDLFLRFPFELQNAVTSDSNKALGWFYGNGRFFYPETRIFLRWHVSEPVDLLVNVRAFYPVYHLWDGAGQTFWDGFMVSAGLGFAIRLKPRPPAAAPAAPAAAAPAAPAAPAAEPAPAPTPTTPAGN
jgi:hypothetical protein